jgi:hypothetical protein
MKAHTKKLLQYTSAVIALIALGLLSRRINGIPDACGDALWAMMVFCCWRIVLVLRPLKTVALVALITSFLVEFSQILSFDLLVRLRSTFLGHMLLGQGFLWIDLLAYTIGIIVIYIITVFIEKKVR